jgi:primosomal protein N' (replication factor Y)
VLGHPPFARLVNLRLDGRDGARVETAADELARRLRAFAPQVGLGRDAVLGPAPPPVARVRGRHRWQVLLRAGDVPALRRLARAASTVRAALLRTRVRLVVDVDPYSM